MNPLLFAPDIEGEHTMHAYNYPEIVKNSSRIMSILRHYGTHA